MDYKNVYTEDYFSGKDSFFYSLGYGRFQQYYLKNLFNPIKPFVMVLKEGKVLDVGCAYGTVLQKFPITYKKYGIDVSEHAINVAQKRFPETTFLLGGAEDPLPFKESYFDFVICSDVLEHLETPETALVNITKVLKEGGILYVNTPNLNWIRRKVFAYADKKEHHISLMTHKRLSEVLTKTRYHILDHWTYTNLTFFFFTKFRLNLGPESAFICRKL